MDHDHSEAEVDSPDNAPLNLHELPRRDREDLYQAAFKRKVPVEEMSMPNACQEHPEFASEILQAYLKYSTFVFTTWTNYDAAAGKFFIDQRRLDCGKLVIAPKALKQLEEIDAHKAILRKIRLDIGTAFRTLVRVTLEVRPAEQDVGLKIDAYVADLTDGAHPMLLEFIEGISTQIEERGHDATGGKVGFDFATLSKVANRMCPSITEKAVCQSTDMEWRYNGQWMNLHFNSGFMKHLSKTQ